MRSKKVERGAAFAVAVALLVIAAPVRTQASGSSVPVAVTLGPGSVLWLEGTSTVHDFESRSSEVAVTLARAPEAPQPADARALFALMKTNGVRVVTVDVPVKTLRSGKAGLDKNLQRSMKAEQHPSVRFQLAKYALASGAADDTIAIRADGSLAVAGVERPVDLEARAYGAGNGVWLEGSETLLMSEYGIKPPKMMLGTLRVGDRITVRYRLLLVPKGDGTTSSSQRSN